MDLILILIYIKNVYNNIDIQYIISSKFINIFILSNIINKWLWSFYYTNFIIDINYFISNTPKSLFIQFNSFLFILKINNLVNTVLSVNGNYKYLYVVIKKLISPFFNKCLLL